MIFKNCEGCKKRKEKLKKVFSRQDKKATVLIIKKGIDLKWILAFLILIFLMAKK